MDSPKEYDLEYWFSKVEIQRKAKEENGKGKEESCTARLPTAISLRNQRDSPLLRLPAELRNKFYSYAFGEVQITPFICDHGKIFKVWRQGICIQPTRRRVYRANLAALLLVCRQIYVEVALLPFQKFEFSLHYRRDSVIAFNLLMNTFSKKQRETIRHVVLCDGILPEMFEMMAQHWEKREKTA